MPSTAAYNSAESHPTVRADVATGLRFEQLSTTWTWPSMSAGREGILVFPDPDGSRSNDFYSELLSLHLWHMLLRWISILGRSNRLEEVEAVLGRE